MAGYQRKIAYLDYLENGMKIKNAGFVRVEEISGQMRLEMRVKNIPEMFNGQYELKTNTEGVAGRISISRGSGSCCVVWKTGADMPKGKKLVRADGIYVRLPGRRLLQAVWDMPMEICVEGEEEKEKKEAGIQLINLDAGTDRKREQSPCCEEDFDETETSEKQQKERQQGEGQQCGPRLLLFDNKEEISKKENIAAAEPIQKPEEMTIPQDEKEAQEEYFTEMPKEEQKKASNAEEQVCYGDKWEQLTHMFAVIHPFGDEREYLSIAPKDFVILRQEYQKMVHNSFLLHGYYNYKHLILGKIKGKEEWSYYLGVPGNFYGREKMVAEMFGFEAFEGEKEPARAGDFGYYMKEVKI